MTLCGSRNDVCCMYNVKLTQTAKVKVNERWKDKLKVN